MPNMQTLTSLLLLLATTVFTVDASPIAGRALRRQAPPACRSASPVVPAAASNSTAGSAVPATALNSTASSTARRTTAITASDWSNLCSSSGVTNVGLGNLCYELGSVGWGYAISAEADPCVQQNVADQMIFYAKTPGIVNSNDMISYAVAYRQLPRKAVSVSGVVPSSLYCTFPPANPELSGVVNAQPSGATPGLYGSPSSSVVPFGSAGTCPYGSSADVSTCSCTGSSTNSPLVSNSTIPSSTTTGNITDSGVADSNSTSSTCDLCSSNSTSLNGTSLNSTSVNSTASDCSCGDSSDSTNSTLSGTNSTLTGTNSTLNGTDLTNSTTTTDSNSTSTADSSVNGTATVNTTSAISALSTTASVTGTLDTATLTSSADASPATSFPAVSPVTAVSDPEGRRRRRRV